MKHELRDVGGTRGGIGMFLFGLGLAVVGGYLLLQQVDVHGGYWRFGSWGGGTSFGITLIPLLLGIGLLFYDAKSIAGWVLTGAGALILFAGIIANLQIYFRTTSLFNTLVMLGLLVAGLGLIARSLRPVGRASSSES
ncbi:MAG TPA: hypothetical protein VK698_22875 [Kofleriaceae bacterium]|nr:hypothetical protein [Kofleriaceae bacterium]